MLGKLGKFSALHRAKYWKSNLFIWSHWWQQKDRMEVQLNKLRMSSLGAQFVEWFKGWSYGSPSSTPSQWERLSSALEMSIYKYLILYTNNSSFLIRFRMSQPNALSNVSCILEWFYCNSDFAPPHPFMYIVSCTKRNSFALCIAYSYSVAYY